MTGKSLLDPEQLWQINWPEPRTNDVDAIFVSLQKLRHLVERIKTPGQEKGANKNSHILTSVSNTAACDRPHV